MTFVSFKFLIFLFISYFAYYALRKTKVQWIVLLIASIVFYACASLKFLLFLGVSIVSTWGLAIVINNIDSRFAVRLSECHKEEKKILKHKCKKEKSLWICICLFINLGILGLLKYRDLFGLSTINNSWIVVPLGISFYTFQSVGYCIDVSRGLILPEKNIFKYALFVSFFPQISQGPIGKYEILAPDLFSSHSFDYDRFINGLERALWGVFKKLVVANRIGIFVDTIYGSVSQYSGFILLFTVVMYAFQLYADFSGYMDIAIGVSNGFGINLSENFKTPYFSKSVSEYWRRWHITLGAWFRDYLYFPILRSEWLKHLNKMLSSKWNKQIAASITTSIGLIITWILTGLWHGSDFNYVAYGLYYGVIIAFSSVCSEGYSKICYKLHINKNAVSWKLFQNVRTFCIVCGGYILFRGGRKVTIYTIKNVFSSRLFNGSLQGMLHGFEHLSLDSWIVIFLSLVVCFFVELYEEKKNEKIQCWLNKKPLMIRWALLYCIITVIVLFGNFADQAGSFLYFQF